VSYNGSGTFNINSAGQPVVTGTVIASTPFNALTADLGTGLSTAITKDGQTTTTARIPFAAGINSSLVTDATNTATGSIITAGGVGVAKALFVGTTANIAGTTTFGVTGAAFPGSTSGTATIVAPAVAGTPTITLPIVTGTLATLAGTETLTNKTLTSPTITNPIINSISGAVIAGQASMESGTAVTEIVTPGRQQFHPSAAKGWAKCATNGTVAVAYNVTSVTDVATGRVRINWTVPFSNAEYVGVASAQYDTSLSATTSMFAQIRNVDTTANILAVDIIDANGTAFQDPNYTMAAAFGDQ